VRVLLVKLSSLGDVVHLLPAVSDALAQRRDIVFDWVVEEAFACIPRWHPGIDRVVPAALRRWRRAPRGAGTEIAALRAQLAGARYDLVVDAQGLLKSALVAAIAARTQQPRVPVAGFAARCAREPLAAAFYTSRHDVPVGQHAITRLRTLLAHALGYAADGPLLYGLAPPRDTGAGTALACAAAADPGLVFVHATTWPSKHWPVAFFRDLAARAGGAGLRVSLPHGNDAEAARAHAIADGFAHVEVLPRMSLADLGGVLARARAVVGADSGLAHLAAAFGVPTVVTYGPTDAARTGVLGAGATSLGVDRDRFGCAPCLARSCRYRGAAQLLPGTASAVDPACFASVPPARVWQAVCAALHAAAPAVVTHDTAPAAAASPPAVPQATARGSESPAAPAMPPRRPPP
jgi:heptosyltransferase-1